MNMLYSQQYSYSFSGQIEEEVLANLALDIEKLEGVIQVKWRYKSERSAGEFLLFTEQFADKGNPFPFSPARVKEVMLQAGLSPEGIIELTHKTQKDEE